MLLMSIASIAVRGVRVVAFGLEHIDGIRPVDLLLMLLLLIPRRCWFFLALLLTVLVGT
jgi:hypothetical protein